MRAKYDIYVFIATTWVDTSAGELLFPEGTIRPVVSTSTTWVDTSAGELLVPEGTSRPVASTSTTWVDTSAGELLVPEGTIRPVVSGLLDIYLLEFTVPKSRNYY